MFDNLRDDAESSFYEEDTLPPDEEISFDAPPKRKPGGGKILGMTPIQRFIIAVMLMVAVCTLGAMCLLITGKIGIL
jgi:hypothetical protein